MTSSVQKEGFFSEEAERIENQIIQHDKQLFNFHKDLTLLVHQFRRGLKIVPDDGNTDNCGSIVSSRNCCLRSDVFLATRGFGSETRVSCRSIMEAMFKLAYLLVKPESLTLLIRESAFRLLVVPKGPTVPSGLPQEFLNDMAVRLFYSPESDTAFTRSKQKAVLDWVTKINSKYPQLAEAVRSGELLLHGWVRQLDRHPPRQSEPFEQSTETSEGVHRHATRFTSY